MKLGWKPDPPDQRDLKFSAGWPLDMGALPTSHSLRPHVKRVLDQGNTNSCVAHAFCQAITVCEDLAGLEYDLPSRLYLYSCARAVTNDQSVDEGTYLRSAAKALQLMGCPTESFWPFKAVSVNLMPSVHAHMMGNARRGGTYRRITGSGETRLQRIRAAIAGGHPVAFGTDVTESFCRAEGPSRIEAPRANEPNYGGHAMLVVGYDPNGFEIVNSWGLTWRDRGFAWLSNEYMAAPYSSDFWVVEAWQRIREARAAKESA